MKGTEQAVASGQKGTENRYIKKTNFAEDHVVKIGLLIKFLDVVITPERDRHE